jgi:hypothetical protein
MMLGIGSENHHMLLFFVCVYIYIYTYRAMLANTGEY